MMDLPSVVEAIIDLITHIERLENSENGCEIGSIVLRPRGKGGGGGHLGISGWGCAAGTQEP